MSPTERRDSRPSAHRGQVAPEDSPQGASSMDQTGRGPCRRASRTTRGPAGEGGPKSSRRWGSSIGAGTWSSRAGQTVRLRPGSRLASDTLDAS